MNSLPQGSWIKYIISIAIIYFANPAIANDAFEKEVRPLLVKHCYSCHGPEKQKGGLRLDSKAGWQTGGDSGPAIHPGKPSESLVIQAIQGKDGLKQMPPKEKLTTQEIDSLVKWVREGAIDPRDGERIRLGGTTVEDAKKWWAYQPVKRPMVPQSSFANPIDAFLDVKLSQKGLHFSPSADRRTLLRRVTYDLTGLPPTAAEVTAFEQDASPGAFARVVDRLLASPHYGERWGRHWLDLVRYADTAGENSDHPLPHAWRYRNWVIDAINSDMPYDTFIREQIAGDLLAEKGPPAEYASRVIATGYMAMARRFDHDSDKSMHLTHEDGIDTLGKAFLGLTLGCARCHDHKYDAITAQDYYALYGIFESTKFSFPGCEAKQQPRDMVPLMPTAEWNRVVKPYQDKLARLEKESATATADQKKHAQEAQAMMGKCRQVLSTGEIPDAGDKKFEVANPIAVKSGEMIFLSITPLKNHGADSTLVELDIQAIEGSTLKWNAAEDLVGDLLAGNPHTDSHGNKAIWWMFDTRNQPATLSESVRNVDGKPGLNAWREGDTPSAFVNSTSNEIAAWTKLPARSLFLHPSANGNVGLAWLSPITGKVRIRGRVKDAHPGGQDGVGWVLEHFAADLRPPFLAQVASAEKRQKLAAERASLIKAAPKQEVAFAVVEGKAADTKLHLRGDPEKLGNVVPRRWLEVFGGQRLKDPSSSGRLELASWIASPTNPLTARVMVNRIWLQHFNKGLVKTPNDFGTRGIAPTHPELLDWLASEFVRSGWSLKAMHRTMLLSEAYKQGDLHVDKAADLDPNNDLCWRYERRRLSAEEIRDSLLVASGQLDVTPAGAHPFPPESSWSYSQHVPFSTFYETNKRSIYLVQVRNRRHPFLGLFDAADPNATTPVRQTTTVPTQALYFMNDPFFHQQAQKLAERVMQKPGGERLAELFRLTLQRAPTAKDVEIASRFLARKESTKDTDAAVWTSLARIVLASNEFLFLE